MTLTETVFWTKIMSKVAGVFVIIIIVGYYAYIIAKTILTPPEQVFRPNFKCGVLPEVVIEAQEGAAYGNATFQVATLSKTVRDDDLEHAPLISYIYKLNIQGENFQTRSLAESIATDLSFTEPVQHTAGSTLYVWKNRTLRATLTFNTDTFNFTYDREGSVLPKVPNLDLPTTTFRAPEFAANYLRSLGVYSGDFVDGKSFAYPVIMANAKPYLAESFDKAQLVRVDFQKVNPLLYYDPIILSPTYNSSSLIDFVKFIELIDTKGSDTKDYVKLTARRVGRTPETANVQVYMRNKGGLPAQGLQKLVFNNWRVDETPCGTYLLIRPSNAIAQLANGQGTIVYLAPKGTDPLQPKSEQPLKTINLLNMELAYYEANQIQKFLQPVYVATGEVVYENGSKGDIAIYISAIDYGAQPKK